MIVAASATLPVPSNEIAAAVTKLPVIEKFLAVSSFVAVVAVPVKFPTKVGAVTTPETLSCLANSVDPVTVVIPAKVEKPETLS